MSDKEKLFELPFPEIVGQYGRGYDELMEEVKAVPVEALHFRPETPDAWTIYEHIVHVVDCEVAFLMRLKYSIAEPGKNVTTIDGSAWQKKLYGHKENVLDYLEMFRLLRNINTHILADMTDAQALECHVTHPERGKQTLKYLCCVFTAHVPFHREYIRRNLDSWKK